MSGFFAMLSRMKYITRWGLMRCTRGETLSEHALETAMVAHALVAIANQRFDANLDPERAVTLAVYHDCSEIITGDLPTPIKYHNKEIKKAYKEIEHQANSRLLAMLPDDLLPEFSKYLNPSEEFLMYEPYIKAADKLSAIIKCTEELSAGNNEFRTALNTCLTHESLELPAAKVFVKEFLPAYSLSLDEVECQK